MKKESYTSFVIIILKLCIIVYSIYMLFVLLQNILLKEIYGEITFIHNYQEHIIRRLGRFEGGLINKGYVEENLWRQDIYYKYSINKINYSNSKISNVLIFPNIEFNIGEKIKVHYLNIYPKYSILYKCTTLYFIINLLPIMVLIITIYLIRYYVKKNKKKQKSKYKNNIIK